jgi:hypothetical protein
MLGKLCSNCHFDGGPATDVATHSSKTTDAGYGNWDLDCWACHNPHTQEQNIEWGSTYGKYIKKNFGTSFTSRSPTTVKEINPADVGPYYTPIGTFRTITSDEVEFKGDTEFVDGDGLTEDDICQVCHENASNYGSGAINSHTDYGPDTQPGGNCTSACHLHSAGFSPAGASCTDCHASAQPGAAYRRQIVSTGGDFQRASHHVTDGTTTEVVTTDDCQVCHNQSLHTTNSDPDVLLNDVSLAAGATIAYDGTGNSVRGFCLGCHNATGPHDDYDYDGSPDGINEPFTDGRDPQDINTNWSGASHNIGSPGSHASSLDEEACLACHGGADSTVSESVTDHNVHGGTNDSMVSGLIEGITVINTEEEVCFACHTSGGSATADVETAMTSRTSGHIVANYTGIHDATEDEGTMTDHVECLDCHNPHAADNTAKAASPTTNPTISGTMKGVPGIDASGSEVSAAIEYQVCLRCHGDNAVTVSTLPRQISNPNLRLGFASGNPSQHAVINTGANSNVPSLKPGWTDESTIRLYCTDCHLDSADPNGGVHGSDNPYLLKARYDTADNTSYSEPKYQLCRNCHYLGRGDEGENNNGVLDDHTQGFAEHDIHVRGNDVPCSACHDPHGIHSGDEGTNGTLDNEHLINFRTDIVQQRGGQMYFNETGSGSGWCYLTCHGMDHDSSMSY